MKTVSQKFYLYSAALFLILCLGCDKDDDQYPKIYKYSHQDQSNERQWVLSSTTNGNVIDVNTGTYGAYREEFKEQVAEGMKLSFELKQIDLLSDNMVRIQIQFEEEFLDTTVTYTMEDENLVIEALGDSELIGYDENADEFFVCGFASAVIPGPNVVNPGQQYNQYTVQECQDDATLEDYLDYVLSQDPYLPLDTVVIFITKFIYTKQ